MSTKLESHSLSCVRDKPDQLKDEDTSNTLVVEKEEIYAALKAADKIDEALPVVRGLEMHDTDMDTYARDAAQAFQDLMDLGMNVESRHAGDIFAAAQRMLKNAIEAKNAKADRKLRAIELQLKKMRADQNEQKNAGYVTNDVIDVDYVVSDRNSLINELTKKLINDK